MLESISLEALESASLKNVFIVFITKLSLGLDTPRAPKFTFCFLIGVCSVRGANCSLYQVDIVGHISINGVYGENFVRRIFLRRIFLEPIHKSTGLSPAIMLYGHPVYRTLSAESAVTKVLYHEVSMTKNFELTRKQQTEKKLEK